MWVVTDHIEHFGTGVEMVGPNIDTTIMRTSAQRYQKIKTAARQLMLVGDMDRYLHALRLLSGLRPEVKGAQA